MCILLKNSASDGLNCTIDVTFSYQSPSGSGAMGRGLGWETEMIAGMVMVGVMMWNSWV